MEQKLKEARIKKGYTLEQVAQKLSTTKSAMSMYETGKREVNNNLLVKLSNLYGVSTDYLLGIEKSIINQTNDLGFITDKQKELFKMIQTLDNDKFFMVYGYVARLLNEAVI